MLLSEVMRGIDGFTSYEIKDEKIIDTLSLVSSKNSMKCCTFIDHLKYIDSISDNVIMIITTADIEKRIEDKEYGLCIVENPRLFFFKLHNFLSKNDEYRRKIFKSSVGENCKISNISSIAPNNVVIGNNVTIEEFVVIRENTIIGSNTVIRAGTVIGGEGYEIKREKEKMIDVMHLGGVVIGSNVRINHNVVIDRAVYPWDNTEIGDYSRIDSLVEIAHGVKIGKSVMVIATASIFGRTVVEHGCRIGPGAILRNGLTIGKYSNVNLGSVVTNNLKENENVTGYFAIQHDKFISNFKKTLQQI